MQERTALEDQLNAISRIERDLEDQVGMIELGEAEKDQAVVTEAEEVLKKLKAEAARRELEALLSGEADGNDSYLEVHAGAGGTESQDWAGMLLRMYTRWARCGSFHSAGSSAALFSSARRARAVSTSKMPPQQPDRLLDLIDDVLDFCAHGSPAGTIIGAGGM